MPAWKSCRALICIGCKESLVEEAEEPCSFNAPYLGSLPGGCAPASRIVGALAAESF